MCCQSCSGACLVACARGRSSRCRYSPCRPCAESVRRPGRQVGLGCVQQAGSLMAAVWTRSDWGPETQAGWPVCRRPGYRARWRGARRSTGRGAFPGPAWQERAVDDQRRGRVQVLHHRHACAQGPGDNGRPGRDDAGESGLRHPGHDRKGHLGRVVPHGYED